MVSRFGSCLPVPQIIIIVWHLVFPCIRGCRLHDTAVVGVLLLLELLELCGQGMPPVWIPLKSIIARVVHLLMRRDVCIARCGCWETARIGRFWNMYRFRVVTIMLDRVGIGPTTAAAVSTVVMSALERIVAVLVVRTRADVVRAEFFLGFVH